MLNNSWKHQRPCDLILNNSASHRPADFSARVSSLWLLLSQKRPQGVELRSTWYYKDLKFPLNPVGNPRRDAYRVCVSCGWHNVSFPRRHPTVWPMLQRGCWPCWRWRLASFPWLPLSTCPTWLAARCPRTSTSRALINSCGRFLSFVYIFICSKHILSHVCAAVSVSSLQHVQHRQSKVLNNTPCVWIEDKENSPCYVGNQRLQYQGAAASHAGSLSPRHDSSGHLSRTEVLWMSLVTPVAFTCLCLQQTSELR